jgi:zinc-ribbon domain
MNESCPNCGTEVPEGANFCHQCGRPISQKEPPEERPQQGETPHHHSNAQQPTSTPPPSPALPSGTSKFGNRLNRAGGLAGMVAGILLVASVASMLLSAPLLAYRSEFFGFHPMPPSAELFAYRSDFAGIYLLLGLGTLLLAVASPALRRLQAGPSRRLGLVGFVLTMISAAVLGSAAVLSALFTVIGVHEPPSSVDAGLAGGFALLLVGLFIFGIAMARANVQPRWAALLLALGNPLGFATTAILYGFLRTQAKADASWAAVVLRPFPLLSLWSVWVFSASLQA